MVVNVFNKGKEKQQMFINADYIVKVTPLNDAECIYRGVKYLCDIELHNGEHLTVEGSLIEIVNKIYSRNNYE